MIEHREGREAEASTRRGTGAIRGGAWALALLAAPAAAGVSPPIPGTPCGCFPADNIWNTDISAMPVHSRSSDWVTSIGAGKNLDLTFGPPNWGFPWNVTDASTPKVSIDFQDRYDSDPWHRCRRRGSAAHRPRRRIPARRRRARRRRARRRPRRQGQGPGAGARGCPYRAPGGHIARGSPGDRTARASRRPAGSARSRHHCVSSARMAGARIAAAIAVPATFRCTPSDSRTRTSRPR